MLFPSILSRFSLSLCFVSFAYGYSLVQSYDYTNWYDSFTFETVGFCLHVWLLESGLAKSSQATDPTGGFVDYISQSDAETLGMTKILNEQVYLGVDNSSVISTSDEGRKSIWLESKESFLHGLLIGDFAHMPGSVCGTWPAFWTIRNGNGTYGEIDIIEGFSDVTQNYMTLHTGEACSFQPPADEETGTSNQDSYDCSLSSASGIGCSVIGPTGSYGTPFNNNGGGVYALEWTSSLIKIYFFPRDKIPQDITDGTPDPTNWGLPAANYDTAYGNCDIDAGFPAQTIYFDTTFCGAEAGGTAWTDWTDCSKVTGASTCEVYVAANPGVYSDSYWLVNSVKIYQ
ncbi:MAG: hypothetical protein M1818_006462 [Claussenomyces sp. TS43310]|nr:MAG: hypothetical protein M1818_006462 [Claussenomyces sp. TS43310]